MFRPVRSSLFGSVEEVEVEESLDLTDDGVEEEAEAGVFRPVRSSLFGSVEEVEVGESLDGTDGEVEEEGEAGISRCIDFPPVLTGGLER